MSEHGLCWERQLSPGKTLVTRRSSEAPIPATPGQGGRVSGSAHPYCRLRQQMAMATAALLPGTLAATQVSSTA